MAKEHKYHRSRIEITTALPVDRFLGLARETLDTQRKLKVEVEIPGEGLHVVVKNVFGISLLRFTVEARAEGGHTRAKTQLQQYQTSQSTVLFIPVGPKLIDGYGEYRRYLKALQQVIQAADPSARIAITETDS